MGVPLMAQGGRTIGALRAERHTLTSAEWTSCSACHELLCSRAFLFIVLRNAQHPQIPRFLQIFRGKWPMPLSLLNHSALALFAQHTRIPTSARSIGFCAIWVCISSSSSFTTLAFQKPKPCSDRSLHANGVTQLLGDGRLFFWIA